MWCVPHQQVHATEFETEAQKLGKWKRDGDFVTIKDGRGKSVKKPFGLKRMFQDVGHGGPYTYKDPQPVVYYVMFMWSETVVDLIEEGKLIVQRAKTPRERPARTNSESESESESESRV